MYETGECRHKENCAYKHQEQPNKTDQGALNEAMLTLIILQQQQITSLSEEVKSLKSLNQNQNNDIEVIEKVHVNEDTKKDSLVKEVSDESYKCDVCEYKCKSEITLIKHTNTKHQTQNTEKMNKRGSK